MIDNSRKQPTSPRDVRKDLRAIYERADGSVPDMSRITSRKRSRLRRFLMRGIILLLVLSGLAWTGFFLFSNGFLQKRDQISVNIEGPTEAKSGDEVTYKIHYENTGDVPVASLELSSSFPPDFHLTSSTPATNDKNSWTLGSLTPKSDGVVTVTGTFLSEVPSTEKLQTLFTYKPANFNSSFQTVSSTLVNITESVVELTMIGPDHALPGDQIQYAISVGHTQKTALQNLRVMPALPENFTVSGTDPAFENGEHYWNLASLDPNQPKTFTIKGSYTAGATGEHQMGATVGFMSDNVFLKQKEIATKTSLQGGSLSFHLIVNGSNTDQTIEPGKSLRGSIDFKNESEETMKDVSFVLSVDGTGSLPIDWTKADVRKGNRSGNQIIWDGTSVDALKALKPNDSGIVDFIIPLSPTSSSADHFTLGLTARIGSTDSVSTPRSIPLTPITLSMSSQVSLSSEARYFTSEGQPIGSGPLPPTVGQTTTYRVFITISNALHDLSGVSVTTTLPANVTWANKTKTDIGTLSYKDSGRSLTWSIPKLPTSIPNAGAWFDVSVTPKSTDVNTSLPLTGSFTMSAKDNGSSQTLSKTADALTTTLSSDEFASGKGVVVAK